MHRISSISSNAGDVENTATNLVIEDVLKIKMKKKKMKRKFNTRKFEEICYHCGLKGHISRDCWVQSNDH